ncbi:hypothetical protein GQX74_011932 [Glossina fuscipes]|nr:hypothetical protein GQX74_011932 [Glossina fuscipes]
MFQKIQKGCEEYTAIDYCFAYKIKPPRLEFFATVPYNCHDDIFSHSKYAITDQPETPLGFFSGRLSSPRLLGDICTLVVGKRKVDFGLGGECIRNISRGKIFIERPTLGGVMNDERYSGSVSIKPVKRKLSGFRIGNVRQLKMYENKGHEIFLNVHTELSKEKSISHVWVLTEASVWAQDVSLSNSEPIMPNMFPRYANV